MSSHRTRPARLAAALQANFYAQPQREGSEEGQGTLYNFQAISSVLVFDIIRELLSQKLTEFELELLLKVVRSGYSAGKLRLDGPSALKDIICVVQIKLVGQDKRLRPIAWRGSSTRAVKP
ncbi:hypothetical protein FIBSPDRAFT_1052614 [Athelia psychrophila]|uniref:Uncharacterized protein n=1 Tax=Athelia psychrophila TaxID=1759441 RepID=A0A165WZ43_9AGAM|nr:hypothetical protein FIBSPDRAFT_1052614 [Fibularhizoctonia sp. CBS 109695]